jgi:hypothetical protein
MPEENRTNITPRKTLRIVHDRASDADIDPDKNDYEEYYDDILEENNAFAKKICEEITRSRSK